MKGGGGHVGGAQIDPSRKSVVPPTKSFFFLSPELEVNACLFILILTI